jgi:hypothetical protein
MEPDKSAAAGGELVFRASARAFLVYYVAMFLVFVGPTLNPAVGLPRWLGFILGLLLVAAVVYMRWGQEYRITPTGVAKIWGFQKRRQDIPWENLEEVVVLRGLTQTVLKVGNLLIRDKTGDSMFWFGLADPKGVKELIDGRRA